MNVYRICYDEVNTSINEKIKFNYLWIVAENFENVAERANLTLNKYQTITDISLMGKAIIDYRTNE